MSFYNVYVTKCKLPVYDASSPPSFVDVARDFADEFAFAEMMLRSAAVGDQLHCHYKGDQLRYIDQATKKEILLAHTYVKIKDVDGKERILVKVIRKMTTGKGTYAEIKTLFDVETGEKIVEKKAIGSEPLVENIIAHAHDGFIANVERLRHPLKWIDSGGIQSFGSNTLRFVSPEIAGRTGEIAEKKRKTIHYFEYRGKDLADYFEEFKDKFDEDMCIKVASGLIDALHNLHKSNLLHCDVKEENSLILWGEDTLYFSFCDYDFAVAVDSGAAVLRGTIRHMAPELVCWAPNSVVPAHLYATVKLRTVVRQVCPEANLGNHQYRYTTASDVFALCILVDEFFKKFYEEKEGSFPLLSQLHSLFQLMRCYHPKGRPSLRLMQLVIILFEFRNVTEETLPAILRERNLPNISLHNLKRLTAILLMVGTRLEHDSPNAWPVMILLQQRIETALFSDNPLTESALTTELRRIRCVMRLLVFLVARFQFNVNDKGYVQNFQSCKNAFTQNTPGGTNAYCAATKALFDRVNTLVRFVEMNWGLSELQADTVTYILDRFSGETMLNDFIPMALFSILNPNEGTRLFYLLDNLKYMLALWAKNQPVMDFLQKLSLQPKDFISCVRFIFFIEDSSIEKQFFGALSQKNVHAIVPAVFSCFHTRSVFICRLLYCRPTQPLSLPNLGVSFVGSDSKREWARTENALIATVIGCVLKRCISDKELSTVQNSVVQQVESQLTVFFENPQHWNPSESVRDVISDSVIESIRLLLHKNSQGDFVNVRPFISAVVKAATTVEPTCIAAAALSVSRCP